MRSTSPSSASSVPYVTPTTCSSVSLGRISSLTSPQDMFTNTREAWHPPGARGIFGGVAIAQCIAAGQRTVAADFLIHSCHCYFLLAGLHTIPITYHVERVRDGRSFATRTVQARQRGNCIFTTTMSFARGDPKGRKSVTHAVGRGKLEGPPEGEVDGVGNEAVELRASEISEGEPSERKCTHWVRAKGEISTPAAHVAALAYMTDMYFLGTIPRVHDLLRPPPVDGEDDDGRPRIGMMVSLDHSIYFHEPGLVRADEWMFTEMESPWAGNGRGVVTQRVFSKEGVLLATCLQEGVVRLKEEKAKL